MLVTVLLTILVFTRSQCPNTVSDQLELVSQPLQCFRQLYNYKQFDSHRISRVVNDRLQTYKRILQELSMSDQTHLQTSPVLKWAQSQSQIFISFKLSHRQDSPTCSDLRAESFSSEQVQQTFGDIQFQIIKNQSVNVSSFSYKGQCFFTSQKFLFILSLHFEGLLKKIVFRKQGLGLYTLIGDKYEPKIWIQPFNDYKKAAIWSEMRYKHSGDMDKYFEQAEAFSESNKAITKKRSRRRPKKEQQGEL